MKKTRLFMLVSVIILSMLFVGITLASDVDPNDNKTTVDLIQPNSVIPLAAWPGPDGYGYMGQTVDFSWIDITTSGTLVTGWTNRDDGYAGPFPIVFTFTFYGTDWTEFFTGSNGFVSFGSGSTSLGNQCPLPNSNSPNNIIPILWDDLNLNTSGDAYYQYFDTCPVGSGQCTVIEYYNTAHFGGAPGSAGTWEVLLFDSNEILIQFLDAGDELGLSSTTGIENDNSAEDYGLTYACDTADSLSDELSIDISRPSIPILSDSTMSAPFAVEFGDPIYYSITISNTGDSPAMNATLEDPIPEGTIYNGDVACDAGTCEYDEGLNQVEWEGVVDIDSSVIVSFSVLQDALGCGDIVVNEATINDPEAVNPVIVSASTEVWQVVGLFEGFEGEVFPPDGWTETHDITGTAWTNFDLGLRGNLTGGIGKFAIVDDDEAGSAAITKAELLTPAFDIPSGLDTYLVFKTDYNNISADESADVDISLDGGETWMNLLHWNTDHRGPLTQSLDLTTYAGETGAIVRFYYDDGGHFAWWWEIDDVEVVSCYVPRPDIGVNPLHLNATLLPDQQETQELNICNAGDATLDWSIAEVSGMTYVGKDVTAHVPSIDANTNSASRIEPKSFPARDLMMHIGWVSTDDINVLIVTPDVVGGGDINLLLSTLSAFPDLVVTVWDGNAGTPTVAGMLAYDVVLVGNDILWSSSTIDKVTLSNNLADYVDAGGKVLVGSFVWSYDDWGFGGGRFITDDYSPYEIASNDIWDAVSLGTYDPLHPIMDGITSVTDNFNHQDQLLSSTGTWVASWSDGENFVAVSPNVVGLNQVYFYNADFGGQVGELLHNTLMYLAGPAFNLPWLSEDPTTGTVLAGECQIADITFDSTGLVQDVYTGGLNISSNDPDEPDVLVDVTLTVPFEADLAVDKTANTDEVRVGDLITYTLDVSNAGPYTATNVIVTDTLPAEVTFKSSETCTEDMGLVSCELGNLETTTISFTIIVTATQDGMAVNKVEVVSDEFDPNPENNMAEYDIAISPSMYYFYLPIVQNN
jgi:uncharacterized repeat protein (TIGR01451 family)